MIPVIWYNQCRGNWDHGTLLSVFEKYPDLFPQFNDITNIVPRTKRGIIIIAGKPDPNHLRNYLMRFDSGVVILTSEEDAFFNWQYAVPDHLGLWTQYYSPSTKEGIKDRLLLGAPNRIRNYKINKHLPKRYMFSFVGQVQNPFRQECMDALNLWGSGKDAYVHVAGAFGGEVNGIEYQQYLDIMCKSKYVICPAGSMCVDSFRLYEALECGAIPITDRRSPRDPEDFNYWDAVYSNHGIVFVNKWSELGMLVNDLQEHSYTDYGKWWEKYKRDFEKRLLDIATR